MLSNLRLCRDGEVGSLPNRIAQNVIAKHPQSLNSVCFLSSL